jgi:hypothetical protein
MGLETVTLAVTTPAPRLPPLGNAAVSTATIVGPPKARRENPCIPITCGAGGDFVLGGDLEKRLVMSVARMLPVTLRRRSLLNVPFFLGNSPGLKITPHLLQLAQPAWPAWTLCFSQYGQFS